MKKVTFLTGLGFLVLVVFQLNSCRNDTTRNGSSNTEDLSVVFQCEPFVAESGDTLYGVYAIVEDYKIKLDETDHCEAIAPDRFEELQIPPDALAAVGGRSDGTAGTYFYAEHEAGQLLLYRRETGEDQAADKGSYKLVATFKEGNFNFIE